MYIKLTRFDNRPVWLNAAFVVTVEPRRDGKGAVVVPIGDGLDYDVRETPEEVLRMLEGCPVPKVVPVPVSDCLTKTPDDVSPEPEQRRPFEEKRGEAKPAEQKKQPAEQKKSAEAKPVEVKPAEAKPVEAQPVEAQQPPVAGQSEGASVAEPPPEAVPVAEVQPEVAKVEAAVPTTEDTPVTGETPATEAAAEEVPATENAPGAELPASAEPTEDKPKKKSARERAKKPVAAKKAKSAKKPELELDEEEIVRLLKLSPKSVAKLKNTLASQFRVEDVSETVAALEAKGVLSLDGNHVVWNVE